MEEEEVNEEWFVQTIEGVLGTYIKVLDYDCQMLCKVLHMLKGLYRALQGNKAPYQVALLQQM